MDQRSRIGLWVTVIVGVVGGLAGSLVPEPLIWALAVIVLGIIAFQDVDKHRKLAKASLGGKVDDKPNRDPNVGHPAKDNPP